MNILRNKRNLKMATLLSLGVSGIIYAVAVFIPSTQPTVLLGQYALASRDLTRGDTLAYRPWFENGAWQGDIIQYDILADGTRRTDVAIGVNPATHGSSGYCGPTSGSGCWSARATYRANGADSTSGTYWKNRNIITNNSGQVTFTWDQLSPAQRSALDQDTVNAIIAAADPTLNSNAYISDILNYIRGERLHEKINDTVTGSKGDLRTRYSVLGDITSTPVYIGPPKELLGRVSGYTTFANNNASRAGRLAVGANDGMLHILDVADGSEVFSYIPSMVIDKLSRLAARYATYTHTYYVDGEMTVASAQIGASTPVWHTILTGGGGAGFEGLYALDMTDPAYPGASPHNTKLLFEKTGGNWGHVYGRPRIAPIGNSNSDPTWYIFTGNGYSTSTGQPTSLMMVNLDDSSVTEITAPGTTGGLSAPVLMSTDADDMVELAFAGDLNGDLWMFEINQTSPSSSTATKIYDGSAEQPITNAPAVGEHPTEAGYIVYFGTGSILSTTDALNDGENPAGSGNFIDKQAIHAIWVDTSDMTTLKSNLPYTSSDLQTQTLVEASKVFVKGNTAEKVRIVPSPNPVYYRCPFGVSPCPTLYKGWKVDLPNCGERLVGSPFLRAGRLQFVTNNPTGLNCGDRTVEGDSWVMSLDYVTGGDADTIVYNLNADNSLDAADTIQVTSKGTTVDKPPVALNLGKGNISQPTFARLKFGIDKMYINGILLPIPPIPPVTGPILGGHIDVQTDSYLGGVIAPNGIDKHSEGYGYDTVAGSSVTQVNDQLGRAVDGHVHNYDEIHDVDYVDLFELEPRRGKANLVATLGGTPSGGSCSSTPNNKEILVNGACIEAVEGELNRAYDTLHTDADGNTDPLNGATDPTTGLPTPILQSEVHILNATNPPDYKSPVPDTKFIVVLANADLSPAGTLQIGCRTWPVVAYQDMITKQLQAGIQPDSLKDNINGGGLVFTLASIMAEDPANCPQGEYAISKGLSDSPTIRVGFGQRSILDEGIHATRSQCVLGLHDYRDAVCFSDDAVLTAAEGQLAHPSHNPNYVQPSSCGTVGSTIPMSYVRDPYQQLHITQAPSSEGLGLRWRNGALTVQLLDADIDPKKDLQDPATMIRGAGTHAQAYTAILDIYGKFIVTATEFEEANHLNGGMNESGLLYEATMFWHYSDLVDKIRNSDPTNNSTPKDAGCYGGKAYSGKNTIDAGGLTQGEYQALTNPLLAECAQVAADNTANGTSNTCDLDRYGQLLAIIDNAQSDAQLNQALLDLANLLANNAALAAYADLRNYVGDKIPERFLLDIDKGQIDDGDSGNTTTTDGTPATVITIETIDLEARGPNFVFGRRNWVDIRR